MKKILLTLSMLLIFAFAVTAGEAPAEEKKEAAAEKKETKEAKKEMKLADLEMTELPTGVRYYDIVVGTGKECKMGSKFECHYTLWFADENGEKGQRFQSSKDTGKTFKWVLGDRLVNGWSDGMAGMKEGGTRLVYVPYDQGYGAAGGGQIPPKANLIFEIEYIKALN